MRGFIRVLVIISAAALVMCSCSSNGTAISARPSARSAVSAPSAPSALLASGVELPASQIPWKQVGPGWILATWSPTLGLHSGQTPPAGQPTAAPLTLYLLDPAGQRYAITTFPLAPPSEGHTPRLVDWSGDGRHALFEDEYAAGGHGTITEVDLATGAKQTFPGSCCSASFAYSRPTGQAILLSNNGTRSGDYWPTYTLERIDRSGTKQLTFPTDRLGAAGKFDGRYLQTPDGKQLVLGTDNGMVVMGNDGVVVRQLPMPGPRSSCAPLRWWTSAVILAACDTPPPIPPALAVASEGQLWQVPLAGAAPTALTLPNSHGDAWQLSSGTFLNPAGCSGGDRLLARLGNDMQITQVTVPGVDRGQLVFAIGVTADKLLLEAPTDCHEHGMSLLTYDPAANTSTVVLGPPLNGGAVKIAILYPTP
jgi:TolB protein